MPYSIQFDRTGDDDIVTNSENPCILLFRELCYIAKNSVLKLDRPFSVVGNLN